MNKDQLISQIETDFNKQFEIKPKLLTLTPGRINIIGEHTDYNEGLAMPVAIDRWICAAVCKCSDKTFTIYSQNYNENVVLIPHKQEKFKEVWKQLADSTLQIINTQFNIDSGVNMVIGGNIPIGCGLSSSSAFVISIVQSVCHLFKIQIKDRGLAELCQKIENNALGTAGGRLDQYGIILSKKDQFMLIDFYHDSIEYISAVLKDCSWILINSKVYRELSESAYLQRVKECNKGLKILKNKFGISSFREIDGLMIESLKENSVVLYKRLCHLLDENQRVNDMKDKLQKGIAHEVGKILQASHESLKTLYEVSCAEIDYMIKISGNVTGWYGGRIIGGGFGGCSIHLVEDKRVEYFINQLIINYRREYNIIPEIMKIEFTGGLNQL